jgi:hypothetical protein
MANPSRHDAARRRQHPVKVVKALPSRRLRYRSEEKSD